MFTSYVMMIMKSSRIIPIYQPSIWLNYNLVGGWPTPLKNMKVRLDHHPNYSGKSNSCSKPPTSYGFLSKNHPFPSSPALSTLRTSASRIDRPQPWDLRHGSSWASAFGRQTPRCCWSRRTHLAPLSQEGRAGWWASDLPEKKLVNTG